MTIDSFQLKSSAHLEVANKLRVLAWDVNAHRTSSSDQVADVGRVEVRKWRLQFTQIVHHAAPLGTYEQYWSQHFALSNLQEENFFWWIGNAKSI